MFDNVWVTAIDKFPKKWKKLGLDISMSYQSWVRWFTDNDFDIVEKKSAHKGNVRAEIIATDKNQTIMMALDFDFSRKKSEERTGTSSNSLFSISVTNLLEN